MKRTRLLRVLLFVLAVLPFAACWHYGYINIDDTDYFVTSGVITRGLSVEGIRFALTDLSNAIWMPLTWITYQFDYSLRNLIMCCCPSLDGFQTAYSIAHIQSLVLHGINTILLFAFLRKLVSDHSYGLPFIGALLWAVHPLRTESVVWIASLKDVLSMSFLLAALLNWVDFRRNGDDSVAYWRSHVWFVLACCSKPSVMTFPAMIWLLDAVVLGRFSLVRPTWADWRTYLPSVLIALPVAAVAQFAQVAGGATGHQSLIPFWYKALNALVSIGVYARNTIWPSRLAVQCQIQWPRLPHDLLVGLALGGLVVLLAIVLSVQAFRRLREGFIMDHFVTAGVLWALVTIFPMLGLSAFGGHAFADRFTYIPFVGFCIAALGLPRRRAIWTAGSVVTIAFGLSSVRQVGYWRDDGMLMHRTLEIDGDCNVLAHLNMARYLYEYRHTPDNVRRAADHFARAYDLNQELCQSSTVIYMMVLGECGRVADFPRIQMDFIRWLRQKRGVWQSIDQDITDGLCDLYCPSEDGEALARTRQRVKELATSLLADTNQRVYQIDYFIYLTGELTNDVGLREAGRNRLKSLANPLTGYDNSIRFRFVYD